MEIPRYWRQNKQRYAMLGAVCPQCHTTMFPPRPVCPQCAEAVRRGETFAQATLIAYERHSEPVEVPVR